LPIAGACGTREPDLGREVFYLAEPPLISIIDDEASVREATARLVRALGYATETYACAEDYLRAGATNGTACVITDLQMRGLSGIDLQKRITASGARIPVIIMTAYSNDEIRRRALDAGASGFLTKPLDENKLIACLDKALLG
jgi:FixJ family two-component response regulator